MAYAPRSDSWAAKLDTVEMVRIIEHWKLTGAAWNEIADWIVEEFPDKVERKPAHTGLCEWRKLFMPEYIAYKRNQVRDAGEMIKAYAAENNIRNETYVKALIGLSQRAHDCHDAKTASGLIKDAMSIQTAILEERSIEVKERAQAVKEDELKLALAKFEAAEKRLNAVADAVKSAKTNGGLTEETLKKIEEAAGLL